MKLDSEQDRQVLLGMIHQSTLPGAAVKVVSNLIERIECAEIEPAQERILHTQVTECETR